jgi:hypothetical protein
MAPLQLDLFAWELSRVHQKVAIGARRGLSNPAPLGWCILGKVDYCYPAHHTDRAGLPRIGSPRLGSESHIPRLLRDDSHEPGAHVSSLGRHHALADQVHGDGLGPVIRGQNLHQQPIPSLFRYQSFARGTQCSCVVTSKPADYALVAKNGAFQCRYLSFSNPAA